MKGVGLFMAIWYILRPLGTVSAISYNLWYLWYIFPLFGILYQEKSGNSVTSAKKRINRLIHRDTVSFSTDGIPP
jgi:hypothetical protein